MSQEQNIKLLRFNDWRAGESGTFLDNGPPNSWYGVNMQVYRNGTLGVRPGFKVIDNHNTSFGAGDKHGGTTWVPTDDRTTYPEGMLFFLWYDASGTPSWRLRAWDPDAGSQTDNAVNSGQNPVLSNSLDYLADFHWSYSLGCEEVIWWGQGYSVSDGWPPTGITPPNSFQPGRAVHYKERVYYFRPSSKSARVYYSDAGSPYSFTETDQFFDLGETDAVYVQGAYPLKNGLVFYVTGKAPKGFGEWWVMTGASPRTGTLRRFATGPVPANEFNVAIYNERLYFYNDNNGNIVTVDGATVDAARHRHLIPAGSTPALTPTNVKARQAFALTKEDALILPYSISATPTSTELRPPYWEGTGALEFVNGVWTRHDYWASLDPSSTAHYGILSFFNVDNDKVGALYSDIDFDNIVGSNIDLAILYRDVCLDRPGRANDDYSSNVDEYKSGQDVGIEGQVHLRQIRSEDGRPFTVRRVEIDIDYWKDGGTLFGDCGMDLDIGYSGSPYDWGVDQQHTSAPDYAWTGTSEGLDNNTANAPKRATFSQNIEEARPSLSAEVHLTNIENLAIREVRVWVKYETSPNAL